jgi:putative FmdB family regulatory protein
MPMYRFKCSECDNEIILLRSMSDQSPVFCKECGAQMEKVISKVGVIFKGSGFYSTDSRNNGNNGSSASKSSHSETSKTSSCSTCSSTSCSTCK